MYKLSILTLFYLFFFALSGFSNKKREPVKNLFIENKGQITDQHRNSRNDIDFKVKTASGVSVFVGKGKLLYQWLAPQVSENEEGESITTAYISNRMEVQLLNSNPNADVEVVGQQVYFERYFMPWVNKDNSNDGVVAHSFQKVIYRSVYPNIDWIVYFNQEGLLEYDFVIHPGGKVSDIVLNYQGADKLKLQSDGSILAQTTLGKLKERAPYSYQSKDQKIIASQYVLKDNQIRFVVADYEGTLVLDPVLEWASYWGGSKMDVSRDGILDPTGNLYVFGSTASLNNISTTGVYKDTFQAVIGSVSPEYNAEVCLSKWDSDGNVDWATYYGGENMEISGALACDKEGNIYILGLTLSDSGISTPGVYQELRKGESDFFFVKFDSSGKRIWGTYFGSVYSEGISQNDMNLAIDKFGSIFFTLNGRSPQGFNFPPISPNAFKAFGTNHMYIAKFSPDFKEFVWGTLYGVQRDQCSGIVLDAQSNFYIYGVTSCRWADSANWIATPGAFQEKYLAAQNNASRQLFLAKFDSLGNRIWGTFYGGYGDARIATGGVARRPFALWGDAIYFVGRGNDDSNATVGTHMSTPPVLGTTFNASTSNFIVRFDTSGKRIWGTYHGIGSGVIGTFQNVMLTCAASSTGVYVGGFSTCDSLFGADAIIQTRVAGAYDFILLKFDTLGQREWGTYFGGSDNESNTIIQVDQDEQVFIIGDVESANIATTDAHQVLYGGNRDIFVFKANACEPPQNGLLEFNDIVVCPGTETALKLLIPFEGASYYNWLLPLGWEGESDKDSIQVKIGSYSDSIGVYALSVCGGMSDTVWVNISVFDTIQPVVVRNNLILQCEQLYPQYQWYKDGLAIEGETKSTMVAKENGEYYVSVVDYNNCGSISNSISVKDYPSSINNQQIKISLYPNPSDGQVYFESSVKVHLSLIDILGRRVWHASDIQGIQILDWSDFPTGSYQLEVCDVENRMRLEMIKCILY